jgi:hypothetical protein
MTDRIKWFAAIDEHVELFGLGPFATREEAIDAGRKEYGNKFAVFRGKLIYPSEYISDVLDFDWLMDHLEDNISDNVGNEDPIVDVADGAVAALEAALEAWAKRYLSSKWHEGIGSETVVVADD